METTTQELQYQRLNELIYDEDKIVTTTLLAKELQITKYKAQHVLEAFVKDTIKAKSKDLHLTSLICGKLQNSQGVGIYLVEQNKLNETKSLFDNISSEIVYSVQNGQHIDFNMIASINSVNENGSGPLTSKNCIKRNIKSRKLSSVQSSSGATNGAVTSSKNSKEINNKLQSTIQTSGKDCSQPSQKENKAKQGGIASFFSNSTSKLQNDVKQPKEGRTDLKKKGGIASFFSNSTIKPQNDVKPPNEGRTDLKQKVNVITEQSGVKPANEGKTDLKEKVDAITEQNTIDSDEEKKGNKQILRDKKMDSKDTKVTKDHGNGKKRKKDSKNKGPSKKRKRIQEICDSDSSDIFDDENEDIIEMSDDEPVPTPAPNPVPIPKNKRRKAVDKTYMDDEGFIVTTTEYIYETASEDEEKDSPKQKLEVRIESQRKPAANFNLETKPAGNKGKVTKKQSNVKQATLMSFFKKN